MFGLRLIATPGHTLGHISVYDEAASTFISGDALNNVGGSLAGSAPQYTADMAKAAESVRKIAGLGFEKAFFMHGDPIEKGAAAQIGKLALSLPNDTAALARMLGAEGFLRAAGWGVGAPLVHVERRDHPPRVMVRQIAEQDVPAGRQRQRP